MHRSTWRALVYNCQSGAWQMASVTAALETKCQAGESTLWSLFVYSTAVKFHNKFISLCSSYVFKFNRGAIGASSRGPKLWVLAPSIKSADRVVALLILHRLSCSDF